MSEVEIKEIARRIAERTAKAKEAVYNSGFNDALEQVAKWMDGCCQRAKSFSDEAKAENDSEGIFAWRTDAMAHASRAAHVRRMKKL